MQHPRVRDLMTPDPIIVSPDCSLQEAASIMENVSCGALFIGSRDHVSGIITDRDIVIRAVAKGKPMASEKVADYMTPDVVTVGQDETQDYAATVMNENRVARVLVADDEGRPCGVLTFGRMMRENGDIEEITAVIENAVGHKSTYADL